MAVSLLTIDERYGTKMAIFSVPLADKREVFLCVHTTPYENEHRGVVIVDAEKFLNLWRAAPAGMHRKQAQGNPDTWRTDRKFAAATEGFSQGIANPVPLAQVGYTEGARTVVSYKYWRVGRQEQTQHVRYVSFIDGVTRTIWLLSHGCEAFPVECRMPAALKLHRVAALAGTRVFTVRDVQQGTVAVSPIG
jgi:hypothetical protein